MKNYYYLHKVIQMVTIKQIAELCGVSRGTVDRVLNNRGNVKPEKQKLILDMAKKLNYQPNPAGRALVAQRNNPTVGIILPAKGIKFFDDVINPMKQLEIKYKPFGLNVLWYITEGYNAEEQYNIMEEIKSKINALIINPINHSKIRDEINLLIEEKKFIVTLNNDIEGIGEHHYVGSDYTNGGHTAAALLKMINKNEECNIGIMLGSLNMLGHKQRLIGFQEILKDDSRFKILDVQEDKDDDFFAFERISNMLKSYPNINTLFFASSGGTYGACRAILSLQKQNDLTVIAFDTIPGIIEMMKLGVVDVAIYQHPHLQGQKAMEIVFDFLINGIKSDHNLHIMKNDIRILENIM